MSRSHAVGLTSEDVGRANILDLAVCDSDGGHLINHKCNVM